MCVDASITERVVRVRSRSVTEFESTEYAPTARALGDPAVVADQRRPLDLVEVGDLDAFAEPDVAADADAGNVQLHALVERVEVRLPVLVEIPMSCQ
jgi:hypothetical protein